MILPSQWPKYNVFFGGSIFLENDEMTLFWWFDRLMAEIIGANHYFSHMMTQADLDMKSAKFEIQSLRRVNQDLESTLADTELARDSAMLSRNDAMEGRDAVIARTHQLERDRIVSEIQKCRHDRLAMKQLYSDVKKALVAEQSAHEAERENGGCLSTHLG